MFYTLSYFASAIRKDFERFCNKKLTTIGLSEGALFYIIYVGKYPKCSPGEISSALKQDSGHTARMVEKLVKSGFIDRNKKSTDKRAFELELTKKGQEAFQYLHQLFEEWDAGALVGLSAEEKETLLKLLEKVMKNREKKVCEYVSDDTITD